MFKKLYKAMILSRAASAANETLKTLSDRQLDDMGLYERLLSMKLSTVLGKT